MICLERSSLYIFFISVMGHDYLETGRVTFSFYRVFIEIRNFIHKYGISLIMCHKDNFSHYYLSDEKAT